MADFESELKISFLEEAAQLLSEVEKCYLDLETNSNNESILDQIFRVAHNLKGSSKAVGFNEVGQFAHRFENLLLKLKTHEVQINPLIVSLLLRCNDHLVEMIEQLKISIDATFDSSVLLDQIEQALRGELSAEDSIVHPNENDPTTLEVEEDSNFQPEQIRPIPIPKATPTSNSSSEDSIRVSLARLEKLLNYVGEMAILQAVLREQAQASSDLLKKTVHQLGKVTKEVQDISMSLRMVPLKVTFQKMQRIVRDTALDLGKNLQLKIQGEETELDKTILERLNDPLVHLIRNACDHGIESASIRAERNKPDTGTIRLSAFHQNGKMVIEVADDGGGIDPEVLRKKAIEKKILSPSAHISDHEAINLIFHPGFSTKSVVTDVSGRGVGMDVVKHNIESLQGDVLVETSLNKGTTFKIVLPLTLAITDAMVVTVSDSRYVIPLSHIHESVKLSIEDIQVTSGLGEILLLRGETIPLFRLSHLLGRKPAASSIPQQLIALVVPGATDPFAVIVDDIIGQYQVVIKQLGSELQNIRGFSGSSILGDGKPALILELEELVSRYKNNSSAKQKEMAA